MRYFLLLLFLFPPIGLFAQSSAVADEAMAAFEAKQWERAERLFGARLKSDPGDAVSAIYLGRIYMGKKKGKEAIAVLEKAVELTPDDAEAHYWLSQAYFNHIASVGFMRKASLASKGKASAEQSLARDPSHMGARISLIQYYLQAPRIAGGSVDKAKENAEILKTHDLRAGRLQMAGIYLNQDNAGAAEQEYQALLQAFPEDVDVLYDVGFYYQQNKRYDEAFRIFRQAIATADEGALKSYYQLGRTAVLAEEQLAEGIEAYKYYLAQEIPEGLPSHASASWRLGMIYELAARKDEAIAAYEAALETEPDHEQAKVALKRLQ